MLPLSPNSFQTHHDAVLGSALEDSPRALEVREDAGGGKGKGLFATAALDEGDLLFKEQPLVRIRAVLACVCRFNGACTW